MNDITLTLPANLPFDGWLSMGRNLAGQKRHIDWLIGDWITFGREHFPEQIELALTEIASDPRDIKRIERTVKAFPPSLRCEGLSFDHHAHVANIPTQEALPLLKRAERENLNARRFRIEAMIHKVEHGQILPREDDVEDDLMLALVRAWNRATRAVRDDFSEMIADSHLGLIEFEPVRQ